MSPEINLEFRRDLHMHHLRYLQANVSTGSLPTAVIEDDIDLGLRLLVYIGLRTPTRITFTSLGLQHYDMALR